MKQPDILVFMSDQHAPQFMGGGEIAVDTPHLDALRRDGVEFTQAYTPCPLCVPARMAMLSGLRSARTGIFTNVDTLPNVTPTFVHHLAASGYETVLAGRMHFIGQDQRHGFTKRIAPDITLVTWTRPEHIKQERGVFARTFAGKWAPQVVGGGESPVLIYDELVIQAVLDYLAQPHEKPQFILVGTYGPHFPYVAPPELFRKYWDRVEVPALREDKAGELNAFLQARRVQASEEVARGVRAAYCGMIERMDEQIGKVRAAFQNFTAGRGTTSLFGYVSDHGDQAGERDLYGKETFFEKSARIPLIFAGNGIPAGRKENAPVSLLDLGPTICDWAGASVPEDTDGQSLTDVLRGGSTDCDRMVSSEFMEKDDAGYHYALMLRRGAYKFVTYRGCENQDGLFMPEADPLEQNNLAAVQPELLAAFRAAAAEFTPDAKALEVAQARQARDAALFIAWEKATGLNESERWKDNPPSARVNPEICIAGL